ncbi:PX-domain-containing protein [Punctularia strigosozonata HHB-11173 SS5]|uniref:PX-domain-containing protein n=1 Tax=Punctularia strigosozonata (strain HHB-11173) TaxID=741275 RepID=UPI00044180EE|nr:PX-domain-containing protein [Punctularia strigosozonata HHB-11173 SS5]EIN08210.1 PX-domain-containing protein [Punctularia strigosozonata HHB-11173 SS5]
MATKLGGQSPLNPPAASLAPAILTTALSSARPLSDFDAGINSSTAWTEHLERGASDIGGSLSDEELESEPDYDDTAGRPARALYSFDGKAEFRELTVAAGNALEVLKEELPDGWSLVRCGREVGLLPRSYYTFINDFITSPTGEVPQPVPRKKEASTGSITPKGSPKAGSPGLPLIPQNTGEWIRMFPSFRQSLFGGKSLNRFSRFVTSGAEEWVLRGSAPAPPSQHFRDTTSASVAVYRDRGAASRSVGGDSDMHYVDAGLHWEPKVPTFRVLVHSPSKRSSVLTGAYIVYNVTSVFRDTQEGLDGEVESEVSRASSTTITVQRRFSHFVALHTALTRRLPGIVLPPLPEKQYAGRFNDDFVEARRGDLERYVSRLVRHPVVRYAEVLTSFLSCEDEPEWKNLLSQHLSLPPAGPSFYARVYHPAFNLDADEASEAAERFDAHTRAVGRSVQALRNVFGQVREARLGMSQAERVLSYSLLSMITSKPLASTSTPKNTDPEEVQAPVFKGLTNEDGAWCWREGCEECLKLTKAMQRTADTLQTVADLYDDHARRTQLSTHEALKNVAHPSPMYSPVLDTHRSTLTRYKQALHDGRPDEDVAARCETVLNTTMAEIDAYHAQKVEDVSSIAKDHLDGEIQFYDQVLSRLRAARQAYDSPQYEAAAQGPRMPSIYERELEQPRLTSEPLPQPTPHVFDSQPMRPVNIAIQEGVGVLASVGRASVLSVGRFW